MIDCMLDMHDLISLHFNQNLYQSAIEVSDTQQRLYLSWRLSGIDQSSYNTVSALRRRNLWKKNIEPFCFLIEMRFSGRFESHPISF